MQTSPTGPSTAGPHLVADADHVQLCRLVTESAWRVDLGCADTLHELFVDDGELDLGRTYRGRDEICGWGRTLQEANPYPGIRHVASNMRFLATGHDGQGRDTAEGTTVLTVFLRDNGHETSIPWIVGEDHDRFVRTVAGWRFTHRTWTQLFTRDEQTPETVLAEP